MFERLKVIYFTFRVYSIIQELLSRGIMVARNQMIMRYIWREVKLGDVSNDQIIQKIVDMFASHYD